MGIKNLLTIFGFKIVWLSCVIGEIYNNSILGFFTGMIFLIFFLLYQDDKIHTLKTILFFSLLGYFFDSFLSFFNFYRINAQINFILLPLWFLILWPSFSCLFIDVLLFLKKKIFFSISLGAIFGPLSYYAGLSAGLASVSSPTIFLLISLFWACIMFIYSRFF